MLSIYLFTLVYVTLCCLLYSPSPLALETSAGAFTYDYEPLDLDEWLLIVEPSVVEASEVVDSLESQQETNTEAPASFSVSSDVDSEEIFAETGASLTKKQLLQLIKSNGYYVPNLSQKNRAEVLSVYREMVQLINAGNRN